MKVTLIAPVYNEDDNVRKVLDDVAAQSRKPDEFIVVDGGSKDNTIDVLREYKRKKLKMLRIIVAPGSNISQARNIAYARAKNDVVASIDAGIRVDKHWLKNIVANMEKTGCDVSAGMFFPGAQSRFEEIAGKLLFPRMEKVPVDWSPSSRSACYKKAVWKAVGGYPENLYTAEDAVFNTRAKQLGFKYQVARDAKVWWRPRRNLWKLTKQYFLYGVGQGQSGLVFHWPEGQKTLLFYCALAAIAFYPILAIPTIIALPILGFLKSWLLFRNMFKAHVGAHILTSVFIAHVLGVHYGLLRKLFGLVKAPKIGKIREVK